MQTQSISKLPKPSLGAFTETIHGFVSFFGLGGWLRIMLAPWIQDERAGRLPAVIEVILNQPLIRLPRLDSQRWGTSLCHCESLISRTRDLSVSFPFGFADP
jgi:hypothetical protein